MELDQSRTSYVAILPNHGTYTLTARIRYSWSPLDYYFFFIRPDDHLTQWMETKFGDHLGDPGHEDVWSPSARPARDDQPNLIKFFLDRDPFEPATEPPLHTYLDGDTLRVEFRHRSDPGGVVGRILWSTDLKHWHAQGVAYDTPLPMGSQILQAATISTDGDESLFVMLEVEQTK